MDETHRSSLSLKVNMSALGLVLQAYRARGYEVLLGNPDCLATRLMKKDRVVHSSYAVSPSDILVFQWIAEMAPWKRALIIGNSFGFSTFVIAGLCSGCQVDAIDAEVEGSENRLGSQITREIAKEHFPGVQLTTGFSPKDLDAACRFQTYDFIFIDGLHTNIQLVADFQGIRNRRGRENVVYCHDVGMAKMLEGWQKIVHELLARDEEPFDLHFTSFGSTVVVSGYPNLKMLLREICKSLGENPYYFGSKHIGIRTACRMMLRTVKYSIKQKIK